MQNEIEWEATIVLLVAVRSELLGVYDRLKKTGHSAESDDPHLLEIFYLRHESVLIRVLLAKLPDPSQGGDAAAWITAYLAEKYRPYIVAMVGLCAGDRNVLTVGDVVVASATVRHDYGKIEKARATPKSFRTAGQSHRAHLVLKHRRTFLKVPDRLAQNLSIFLNARYPAASSKAKTAIKAVPFNVVFGVMSTGNQVVKVSGVFDYLTKQVVSGADGDEYHRALMALEMEAHAVAYAAENSGVPIWLVVKGVCDHANRHKNDEPHHRAFENAFTVLLDVLNEVISNHFLVEENRRTATLNEQKAQAAFQIGNIAEAREAAKIAHSLGRRTVTTRRRFLLGLTQFAEYDVARQTIAEYRQSDAFYDQMTRGVEATIFWRDGQYEAAYRLLPDDVIKGDRNLLYLRAMSELFMVEELWLSTGAAPAMQSQDHIERARDLLRDALAIRRAGEPPWWIMVNLFWVLRLLKARRRTLEQEFKRAEAVLRKVMRENPNKGTPRLYFLLLLATDDRRAAFDAEVEGLIKSSRSVPLALETVDMVYVRLETLYQRDVLRDYGHYWAGICRWLRHVRTIGRLVRPTTATQMQ
ncbi:MAG: hypothetical protein HY527_07790 [Betaproteobacteria bacterium]|nr:hypothetical protein [Betaproteobacteria bacterium]